WASVSDDADRVAFAASDPTNGIDQIHLWERQTGSVRLLSTDLDSLPATDDCSEPMISGSGNAVVFLSKAQLTAIPTDGKKMAYIHVIETGETIAASAGPGATAPVADSTDVSISWYGSLVTFGDSNAVFLYNLADDTLTPFIDPPSGHLARYPRISVDGRLVYFASLANRNGNAWDEMPHSKLQAYLLDRNNGDIRLVSNIDGEPAGNNSYKGAAAIGASGDLGVAFASQANNLAGSDSDGSLDVFFSELLADANQPPTSTTATAVTLDEDASATINFTAADVMMNVVGFLITELPANGQLFDGDAGGREITAIALPWQVGPHNPRVTFVPALHYNNTVADRDQFSFRYEDLFDSGTSVAVTLAVDNVNDIPVFDPVQAPSVDEGALVSLPIVVTDPDTANSANPDVLTLELTGPGAIVDGQWVYTPGHEIATRENPAVPVNVSISVDDGNGGTAQLDFVVTVTDVNVAPAATDLSLTPATPRTTDVLVPDYTYSDFDDDTEGDSVLAWFVRQPAAAEFAIYSGPFAGIDSIPASATSHEQAWQFTITPIDDRPDATPGTMKSSTIVTIANSAPVGAALNFAVAEDDSAVIDLQGTDADDHPLTFSFTQPQHGVVAPGTRDVSSVAYTPTADYFGDDAFTYTVNDSFTESEIATVTITVNPADDAPTLTVTDRLVLEAGTAEGSITTAMVVVDDADAPTGINPAALTVHLDADPLHGTFRDRNNVLVSVAAPVSYADFPLTYTASDADAFQVESLGLTARDATLLDSATETFQVITGAHLQTISVGGGWNFIAFAIDPVDGPDEVFEIDGMPRHRGELWHLNSGSYATAAALSGGVGYWAWFPDAATFVDIPGEALANALDLPAGWQGVGITGPAATAALPAGGTTGTVWEWDVTRQGYINAGQFERGKGYMLMSQGTTVTFEPP
ncbi:MAG: Ig-like domain-containing protein, partial [Lentisphaeria bacterium]|nr:Ig-like domain-containing protein [Lentisphaeria bacterium]